MEAGEFILIYRDHDLRSRLARYARRRASGDDELAADACQEAWLRISQSEPQHPSIIYRRIGMHAIDKAVAREIQEEDHEEEVRRAVLQGDGMQLLTMTEVLQMLRCSRKTLYNKLRAGELPYIRHAGQRIHFLQSDVDAYLNAHRITERQPSSTSLG